MHLDLIEMYKSGSESSASKTFRHSGMTLIFKYHV
jgi:hypothetical protein